MDSKIYNNNKIKKELDKFIVFLNGKINEKKVLIGKISLEINNDENLINNLSVTKLVHFFKILKVKMPKKFKKRS